MYFKDIKGNVICKECVEKPQEWSLSIVSAHVHDGEVHLMCSDCSEEIA